MDTSDECWLRHMQGCYYRCRLSALSDRPGSTRGPTTRRSHSIPHYQLMANGQTSFELAPLQMPTWRLSALNGVPARALWVIGAKWMPASQRAPGGDIHRVQPHTLVYYTEHCSISTPPDIANIITESQGTVLLPGRCVVVLWIVGRVQASRHC